MAPDSVVLEDLFVHEGSIIVFPRRVLEEVGWGARGVCHGILAWDP